MKKIVHKIHAFLTAIILISVAVPFLPLIVSSFSSVWRWPELLPATYHLRAWDYVLSGNAGTWSSIWTSIIIAVITTMINVILAIPAGSSLARMKFSGKKVVEAVIYAPLIIPPFVAIMGMHLIFIRLGLIETIGGVVIAHIVPSLPYMVRALTISYRTLGNQWEEQAKMLGASWFQRLRHITIPHIMPGIVAGSSLSILISLSQYLITFLVGSGQVITLPIILFPFINGGDQAVGSAYTLLFVGIALLTLFGMDLLLRQYYRRNVKVNQ